MTLLVLFLTFFKIGLFTIGGGYAMIPMILQDVQSHQWMTESQLVDFIAIAESTPGPFAINIATFIGAQQAGFAGAFFATLGVVLPSFLIILLVARWFSRFQENRYVVGILSGLRPAVVGLIGAAALKLVFSSVLNGLSPTALFFHLKALPVDWQSLLIFALILTASLLWKKAHPLLFIIGSGILGILLTLMQKAFFL